jgi:transposase-like protein
MEDLKLKMDEVMFAHIETYLSKPQTISSYCRTHNIKEHVFYYWHSKYKSLRKGSSVEKGFVEIPIALSSSVLQLQSPNGCTCHFTMLPAAEYIRQLLGL